MSESNDQFTKLASAKDRPFGPYRLMAGRWEMLKARIFGRRLVTEDDGYELVTYYYKGRHYVVSFGEKPR